MVSSSGEWNIWIFVIDMSFCFIVPSRFEMALLSLPEELRAKILEYLPARQAGVCAILLKISDETLLNQVEDLGLNLARLLAQERERRWEAKEPARRLCRLLTAIETEGVSYQLESRWKTITVETKSFTAYDELVDLGFRIVDLFHHKHLIDLSCQDEEEAFYDALDIDHPHRRYD